MVIRVMSVYQNYISGHNILLGIVSLAAGIAIDYVTVLPKEVRIGTWLYAVETLLISLRQISILGFLTYSFFNFILASISFLVRIYQFL